MRSRQQWIVTAEWKCNQSLQNVYCTPSSKTVNAWSSHNKFADGAFRNNDPRQFRSSKSNGNAQGAAHGGPRNAWFGNKEEPILPHGPPKQNEAPILLHRRDITTSATLLKNAPPLRVPPTREVCFRSRRSFLCSATHKHAPWRHNGENAKTGSEVGPTSPR